VEDCKYVAGIIFGKGGEGSVCGVHFRKPISLFGDADQLSENTEDGLKILLRILFTSIIITTLIHLRDQARYIWSISDAIRIHSATDHHVIRRTSFSVGRS